MILVDTSVWIDHLRSGEPQLMNYLQQGQVVMHKMVLGELACGNLQNRKQLIGLWSALPAAVSASHAEVMLCIEQRKLMGRGIGYVDIHLLASVMLTGSTKLWSRDKRLDKVASELGLSLAEQRH
ncbi:MAG: type II toxin-antitoxin system VapC family toxin [Thiolinea sp.]